MAFSREEVVRLANLSRLSLSDEQIQDMQKDLGQIVDYVGFLNEVDVSGITPMAHSIDMRLWEREDEIGKMIGPKGINQSKGNQDGLVKVPKIIE